jgi:hypothetical protein
LTPLKLAGTGTLSDAFLSWIGAGALFASTAAFFILGWRRFFSALPEWLIAPPLLLAGLAYPLPWVLDAPRIYEAAILWGAALLMAGLVAAFPLLVGESDRPYRLAVAGILWGLAFASRAVLLLPIAVFVFVIARRIWKDAASFDRSSRGRETAALIVPILVATALVGLYNADRFSNPLEFGYRFAVGPPAGQAEGAFSAFRLDNIPVNLYNYVFAPATLQGQAPYLRPLPASRSIGPVMLRHPEMFSAELVTGLLFTTPFLVFAAFLAWWSLCAGAGGEAARSAEPSPEKPVRLRLMAHSLGLASLVALVPALTIYLVTARYLLDASPLLLLMAGFGAWTAYERAGNWRKITGLAIVATALTSGLVSILLALNNWMR